MLTQPLVIELEGDLDIAERNSLEWRVKQALFADPVILDLSRVHYIDSTCLTVLIRLRKERLAKGYRCELLVVPSAAVRRVFQLTRLDSLWPVHQTVAEAQAALESQQV